MSIRKRKVIRKNCTDFWCSRHCRVVFSDGNSNGGGNFGSASQPDRSV